MSVVYLTADLGPAEVELEKRARKLKAAGNSHASRLAEIAAHQCRMLAKQLASVGAAESAGAGQ